MNSAILQWAARHGVTAQALHELQALFGMHGAQATAHDGESEAATLTRVRLEASRQGVALWRNNVGAGYMQDGSFIRWGLANESAKMNKVIKSGDLIGIRPVVVTSAHVGHTIGQFVSREVKRPGWQYGGTEREVAQLAWTQFITSKGGDACFTTKGDSF
jgi:hypothetical protein